MPSKPPKSHPRSPAWQTDNLFLGASQHWNFFAFLSYPSRGARVPNGEGDPPPRHPSARAALKALTNTRTTSSDPIPMREGSMQPSIYSHRHSPMACPLFLNCGLGSTRCLGGPSLICMQRCGLGCHHGCYQSACARRAPGSFGSTRVPSLCEARRPRAAWCSLQRYIKRRDHPAPPCATRSLSQPPSRSCLRSRQYLGASTRLV